MTEIVAGTGQLNDRTLLSRVGYLLFGFLLLGGFILLLAIPVSWPGAWGETFDHNFETSRTASSLFYTEVEGYWDLEAALKKDVVDGSIIR